MALARVQAPGQVDFAVISIRKDEFDAVLKRFEPQAIISKEKDYLLARVPTEAGRDATVAMVRSLHQGQNNSQHVANAVIADLNPEWILVVGIAGAVPNKEFTLGDVVLSRTIHELDVGARIAKGKGTRGRSIPRQEEYNLRGGDVEANVEAVLATLRDEDVAGWADRGAIGAPRPSVRPDDIEIESGDDEWQTAVRSSIKAHFGGPRPRRQPRWVDVAIATSNDLIRDPAVIVAWRKFIRQFMAVEMESGGIYQAARTRNRTYPVLAIRGISDVVGLARDPGWTGYACHAAASFAYAFVRSGRALKRFAGLPANTGAAGPGASSDKATPPGEPDDDADDEPDGDAALVSKPRPANDQHLPWGLAGRLDDLARDEMSEALPEHAAALEVGTRYVLSLCLAYYFHLLGRKDAAPTLINADLSEFISRRLKTSWGRKDGTPFDSLQLFARVLEVLKEWDPDDAVVRDLLAIARAAHRSADATAPADDQRRRDEWKAAWSPHLRLSGTDKRRICAEWRGLLAAWLLDPAMRRFTLVARGRGRQGRVRLTGRRPRDATSARPGSEHFLHMQSRPVLGESATFSALPFCRLIGQSAKLFFLGWPEDESDDGADLRYSDFKPLSSQAGKLPPLAWTTHGGRLITPWVLAECVRAFETEPRCRLIYRVWNRGSAPLVLTGFTERLPPSVHAADGGTTIEIGRIVIPPGERPWEREFALVAAPEFRSAAAPVLHLPALQGAISGFVPVTSQERLRGAPSLLPGLVCTRTLFQRAASGWVPLPADTHPLITEDLRIVLDIVNRGGGEAMFAFREEARGDAGPNIGLAAQEQGPEVDLDVDTANGSALFVRSRQPIGAGDLVRVSYHIHAPRPGTATLNAEIGGGSDRNRRGGGREPPPPLTLTYRAADETEIDHAVEFADGDSTVSAGVLVRVTVFSRGRQAIEDVRLEIENGTGAPTVVPIIGRLPGFATASAVANVAFGPGGAQVFALRLAYRNPLAVSVEHPVLGAGNERWLWRRIGSLAGFYGRDEIQDKLRIALYEGEQPVFLEGDPGLGKERLLSYFHLAHQSTRRDRIEVVTLRCPSPSPGESDDARLFSFIDRLWEQAVEQMPADDREAGMDRKLAAFASDETAHAWPTLRRLLVDRAGYRLAREKAQLFEDSLEFFGAYLRFLRRRTGEENVKLLLVLSDASMLDAAGARTLFELLRKVRHTRLGVFLVLADGRCPEHLRRGVVPLMLTPWTEDECREICMRCFLYPRLAPDALAQIYQYTQGVPTLVATLARALEQNSKAHITVVDGVARLVPDAIGGLTTTVAKKIQDDFDRLLAVQALAGHEQVVRTALAVMSRVDDRIPRGRLMRVLRQLVPSADASESDRERILDLLIQHGWIARAGGSSDGLAPPATAARRRFLDELANDVALDRLDDRLLAVEIEDRAFVTAARRFGQTGARARREAFDALLAAAEEAIELRDDQTARTILGALAQSLDLGRDEAKIRVVINAAGIAWRSGARDEALAWRERLVANWRSVTARGQRSSLRRGLALFAAWEALRERQPARAALKPLKPHLVTSTLRRRLLTIRRRARLRALTVARDHHLVALEITFFDPDGIGLPQFLRLCRVLDSLWPDLSFDDRLEYLDTLWRIAEDDRCVELLRLASWLPERKLEALKSTLDRTKLLARSETFFDERREPVPAWIGHRYHRRWQAYWARRNEVFGYQDLLASLDKALEIFEKLGAEYVVARVLRDRGRASLDLAEERTDEQERYRNDAYLSFRRSAHVFRRLALGEMHVEALRAAVRVRIGLGTNAELRAAGRDIITDLEELLLAPSLPESEREPTGELLVLAAHVHGDTERVRKYMPKRESERLRDLEYAFARQRAEVALANGDDVSRVDAHRALMTCLHIIDDAHRQFAGAPGGGSLAGLDLPLEEAFVLARLTEVCFALGQHAEMLGDLGRLFELIARWRRVGPGPATDRLWDAVLPGGAKDPDTVVVSLFSRCVEVWHAPDQAVPVRERTPFFRRHLLQGLAGLPCVRRAFEILRRDYPVGASKAEELDLLLLEAEVGLREGAASAEVFDAALSALDAIDLDRETDVRYLAENMQRALRLMLEVRHDLSPLYVWFARVIEHRSHGRGGIEAIARSLAVALGYLSATYQSGDASGRAYYESFVTQAFTLLQEVRDELLTTTALESLVRADFLFREQRDKTLRWIRLWVALALNERDPRSFNSLVSLLCRVISAESGRRLNAPFIERLARMRQREAAQPAELSAATDLPVPPALPAAAEPPVPAEPAAAQTRPPVPSSSPEAEAQNNEAAMEICKRVIRECLAAPSWLAMQPRLTVLFDVVEKVVGDSRRDLRLVTGLALYRSSTSAVSSTLKLITDGWLDSATPQRQPTSDGPPPLAPADRWRVCWTLLLGELATLWPFDGRTGFVLHDVTPSWNLLVTLDRLERIQRSCAVVANASEIRIINGMVFALTQIARHWCFRLADRNLQAWGNFEALEPTSIGLVSLLAQRLDTPNRQRRNFFDAYSYLRALIDQWRLQRDQHFYDRETARAQGLTWIPSPDQSVSLLRRFQTIARRAVESMTNRVWSLKLDDLFSEVLDHLAGPPGTASTEAVYLEPEDVDMRGTLDEYDALVEEILIEGMSQHPVAPPTGPRVTLPPIIA